MNDSERQYLIEEAIPDVRDGLTRTERLILHVLNETQQERGGRNVPTVMLYGRVLEYVNISEEELPFTWTGLACEEMAPD